ncbi:MAG: hypothetical protein ACYC25_12290, partial [Paludibacter sp.]
LVNEVETFNLPPFLHKRNKLLIEYCNLRIKSYELMYKKVENETDLLDSQINRYNNQIDSIVSLIKVEKNNN